MHGDVAPDGHRVARADDRARCSGRQPLAASGPATRPGQSCRAGPPRSRVIDDAASQRLMTRLYLTLAVRAFVGTATPSTRATPGPEANTGAAIADRPGMTPPVVTE